MGPAQRGWRSSSRLTARNATSQPGRYATRLTTTIAATIEIDAASSRTRGSDSQMETPSQPAASTWAATNFAVTVTYRRRLAGPGPVAAPTVVPGCC